MHCPHCCLSAAGEAVAVEVTRPLPGPGCGGRRLHPPQGQKCPELPGQPLTLLAAFEEQSPVCSLVTHTAPDFPPLFPALQRSTRFTSLPFTFFPGRLCSQKLNCRNYAKHLQARRAASDPEPCPLPGERAQAALRPGMCVRACSPTQPNRRSASAPEIRLPLPALGLSECGQAGFRPTGFARQLAALQAQEAG